MGGLRSFFTGAGAAIRTLLVLQTVTILLLIWSVGYLAHAVAGARSEASSAASSADDAHSEAEQAHSEAEDAHTAADDANSSISDIADGSTSVTCTKGD